jgi:hypothetical protein
MTLDLLHAEVSGSVIEEHIACSAEIKCKVVSMSGCDVFSVQQDSIPGQLQST